MILYYCLDEKHKDRDGEQLITHALLDYIQRTPENHKDKVWSIDEQHVEIVREPMGKPYFKDFDIQFSISHTANLWVCLMADHVVGVDVQQHRKVNERAVAKRFFTEEEQTYIQTYGQEGFFDVWCRKEAYVKYTGKGFAGQNFATFTTVDHQLNLAEHIQGIDVYTLEFTDILELESPLRGAYCTEKKENLWIKRL